MEDDIEKAGKIGIWVGRITGFITGALFGYFIAIPKLTEYMLPVLRLVLSRGFR